jgi:hypothetical protein
MMTRRFKAQTRAEAHAKADAWLGEQEGLKNVSKQAYVFLAVFRKDGREEEGAWTVAVRYEQEH